MLRSELSDLWLNLIVPYYQSADKAGELFEEILNSYSEKSRHYHTCEHLKDLLQLSVEYGHRLENVEVVRFAIFYHDIVYKSSRSDNEIKSAALARSRLGELNVFEDQIEAIEKFILCTKRHQPAECSFQNDLLYFLDFDLSILGTSPDVYDGYARAIRMEYKQFPDFLYKPGRKKILKRLLQKPFIFKTADFKAKYEEQAKKNLQNELILLS